MVLTYTFLNHTFLKYIIISHYIYIFYNLTSFKLFGFCTNNSLGTKIKNLDGQGEENWTPIEI